MFGKTEEDLSHIMEQLDTIWIRINCLEDSVASLRRRIDQLEEGDLVEEPVDLSQIPTFLGGTKKVL